MIVWLLLTQALAHPGLHERLEAAAKHADGVELHLKRAHHFCREGRVDEAKAELMHAAENNREHHVELHMAWAHWFRVSGNAPSAEAALDQVLWMVPDHGNARLERAQLRLDRGDASGAAADADAALSAVSTVLPNHVVLAMKAHAQAGNHPAALRIGNRFLTDHPGVPSVRDALYHSAEQVDPDLALHLATSGNTAQWQIRAARLFARQGDALQCAKARMRAEDQLSTVRRTDRTEPLFEALQAVSCGPETPK